MSQTVEQSLLVTPVGTTTATITLDGDSADLRAGGSGQMGNLMLSNAAGDTTAELGADGKLTLGGIDGSGQVRLRDTAGTVRLEVIGQGSQLRFHNAAGAEIGRLGENADLRLGGNGMDGDVTLKDAKGIVRIELDADNQRLRFRSPGGLEVGSLGPNGRLALGGDQLDGDVLLRDGKGTPRIELDADGHRLRLRNAAGNEVCRLGDDADLRLGGQGMDGDVDVYDNLGRRRILLDALTQSVSIFTSANKQVCSLGPGSNLRLGGHGNDGDIVLFPNAATDIFDAAQASILIDAQAGDIVLRNADCAEEFDVAAVADAEPGTVMAIGDDGLLRPSCRAHEATVVGVVSGAGAYRPGIVLDRQPGCPDRRPIALVGKTCVKVSDEGGPIGRGDLLVASSTVGHAMRASDPSRALGTVIGKALAPHERGCGVIPMLIALQ